MMKNTAKSLYLQTRLHSLDDTVVLSFGDEESFYGITRIHVPSSKVVAFNKGVIREVQIEAYLGDRWLQ